MEAGSRRRGTDVMFMAATQTEDGLASLMMACLLSFQVPFSDSEAR